MMTTAEPGSSTVARDALGELVSVGTGRAVLALDRMLKGPRRLTMSLPRTGTLKLAHELGDMSGVGVAVRLGVQGHPYVVLALFDEASARGLAAALLGRLATPVTGEPLDAAEESAIKELVNIMGCFFLEAVGTLLRESLVPTPPYAQFGELGELFAAEVLELDRAMVATSQFLDETRRLHGRFVLALDRGATVHVLRGLGVERSMAAGA